MTRTEFVKFLEENNIPFTEYTQNGADMVYVFERKAYEEKKKHPRKNKDMYVPYLRVSHFDEKSWYTRDNGYCCYMNQKTVLEKVKKLGA